ncbi:3-oxoacid CoA-transferase subunit B [Cloacibacillus sp. An23]|uniref:3-oxoacid CoA-transferase subunit B n=1 Tax=Cloacibacillus sp. An23 TaxID=1965591 RepID=UPI000B3AA749|nr:3-oxoacid CoA-transferase subunit B [Cloacibacillus sp. An23]OUO95226.1 succinyl-CoA--3-ketoacid-CoA transferase [Cloacibacillus sp. An23]
MLPELSENEARVRIARVIASELEDGALVNLGIGIPQLVPDYLPDGVRVILQTENGVINAGPNPDKNDLRVIDAGGAPVRVLPGGAIISAELSFAIMRGGHIDVTVLGALEVDGEGSIANWMIPQKRIPGMGGAMDIVAGAKKVYAATRHFDKNGKCKLVRKCSLPLTGRGTVDVIATEYCVVRNIYGRMVLTDIADDVSLKELLDRTEMKLDVSADLVRRRF